MPHTYFIFDGDFDQFLNPTKLKKEGCIILSYVDVRGFFFVNSFKSIFSFYYFDYRHSRKLIFVPPWQWQQNVYISQELMMMEAGRTIKS